MAWQLRAHAAFFYWTWAQFPVPTSGGSQPPITQAPRCLTSFSGLCPCSHMAYRNRHTQTHTDTVIDTHTKSKWNWPFCGLFMCLSAFRQVMRVRSWRVLMSLTKNIHTAPCFATMWRKPYNRVDTWWFCSTPRPPCRCSCPRPTWKATKMMQKWKWASVIQLKIRPIAGCKKALCTSQARNPVFNPEYLFCCNYFKTVKS